MNVEESSFVKINKDLLVQACDFIIQDVKKKQEKRDIEYVDDWMKEANKSTWWRRFNKIKTNYTREEAIKQIWVEKRTRNVDSIWFPHIGYPSTAYRKHSDIAQSIKDMCHYSIEPELFISRHDFEWIAYGLEAIGEKKQDC